MDNFKTFYNEKNGKAILFFGFYFIFFIFLILYIRPAENNAPVDETESPIKEEITSYDIGNLINSDYSYIIDIVDNDETINFTGTKSNVDYANYPNKYFLDIYNINQLLKRSIFQGSEDYVLTYELPNEEINDILLTDREKGNNTIRVFVNDKTEVKKIVLDLSNYLNKDAYQITINYIVGEENENSSS